MKRFVLLFTMLLGLFAFCANAQQYVKFYDWTPVSGTGYTASLNLVNVAGGQYWVSSYNTVSVSLGTGSNSVCTWQLQGSDDNGTTWFNLNSAQSCTAATYQAVSNMPVRMLQVQVVTYTGTAALTFHWTGSD